MSQDANKRDAAERALAHVEPGTVIGVGTGSTVKFFIEGLGRMPDPFAVQYRARSKAPSNCGRWASRCWISTAWGHWMSTSMVPMSVIRTSD